jgi:GDPmannose 4,6-dehydratase
MRIEFRGRGRDEQGIDAKTGHVVVRVDPRYFRPAEVESLLGDASRARAELGWAPTVSFEALIAEMVDSDLKLAARDASLAKQGFRIAVGGE